jgi:hypothetical protein
MCVYVDDHAQYFFPGKVVATTKIFTYSCFLHFLRASSGYSLSIFLIFQLSSKVIAQITIKSKTDFSITPYFQKLIVIVSNRGILPMNS